MKVVEMPLHELAVRLRTSGLYLRTGPFVFHVRSSVPRLAESIRFLYSQFPAGHDGLADFHVAIRHPRNARRWLRPQIFFEFEGRAPFFPVPAVMCAQLFEWGLNWCVAQYANIFLIVHSAVLERHGRALMLVAPPGGGKSTLAAALAHRGWRLLTDELGLVRLDDTSLVALARPVGLKNESIDIISRLSHRATLGPVAVDATMGRVAHMRPPDDSVARAGEPAVAAWLVFSTYVAHAQANIEPMSKARAFLRLAESCFNYSLLGKKGFDAVATLIDRCDCYTFEYGCLEEAVAHLDSLEPPWCKAGTCLQPS